MSPQRKKLLSLWFVLGYLFETTESYLPVTHKHRSFFLSPSVQAGPCSILHQEYPHARHSSLLQVTSEPYNEEDLVDPSSPQRSNDGNQATTGNPVQAGFLLQIGMVSVLAFVAYTVVTMVISGTADFLSSASHALSEEVLREFSQLGSTVWALVVSLALAAWEVLKIVVPFVGKGIVDVGKVAAPVVGDASSRLTEAATPYIQEATRAVNEAASPYIQEAARAVDESIVAPVVSAVDTNIVAPIQGAQSMVTSQIDSTLNDVGQTVSSTIQGVADQATATVKGAVDAQVITPLQDVTSKVDTTVKETMKSIQDTLTF